ncbi:MAG: hypothetical protein ABFS03_06040 [Chloroflexota bacterium]
MNGVELNMADLSGALLGFTFTILILSYMIGDNPLFRFAIHIFIGVSAAYAAAVTLNQVILPQLIYPLIDGTRATTIVALAFLIPSLLLLTKLYAPWEKFGNPAVAIMVGVGAAAAVGGASLGTVFPQVSAAINTVDNNNFINALILTVGTLTTLIYFQFSPLPGKGNAAQKASILHWVGQVGQIFIAITFGALFTGVYLAALSALIDRLSFLWSIIRDYFVPIFF